MSRVILGSGLILVGAVFLLTGQGWRMAALWLVGAALGLSLLHASFSFAGAFRRLLAGGQGDGFRAQLWMLALALLLFQPAIMMGTVLGQPVRGFVFPVGVALLLGAFLFGIGMQLGGGCGSGTLFTAAGGQDGRMWITLGAFIAGATLAAWDGERWLGWPAWPGRTLGEGWSTLPLSLAGLGLGWGAACGWETARRGHIEPLTWGGGSLLRGPWPWLWGAAALAGLNFLTLLLAGRPWAITAAFPIWGSQLIDAAGWDDPAFWAFWEDPTRSEALLRPMLSDRTTVMDLGLMGGALLAAGLAGRRGGWRLPAPRAAAASLLGGVMLGYGAVLGSGCNISAFFGGIASGSLHGWVWIVPALVGNWVGLKLRPTFGLPQN